MRSKTSVIVTVLMLTIGHAPACFAQAPPSGDALLLKVSLSNSTLAPGEDLTVTATVSTAGDKTYTFRVGSFAELFGVYLLGPWGVVQPDAKKILPQNWMHQEHSASKVVTLRKGQPFEASFKLSDFFDVQDGGVFRPGRYQLNVKFYSAELGMRLPIDSEAGHFAVGLRGASLSGAKPPNKGMNWTRNKRASHPQSSMLAGYPRR